MDKKEVKLKLDKVLSRFGMDTTVWSETISHFREKLELLSERNTYNNLLKSLFASNDLSEFNSYLFEVMFSYDFEIFERPLIYEVNQLKGDSSSIDFLYKSDEFIICFELRLIQQRNCITTSIESQLAVNKFSETLLNGDDETVETIRLQNLILSKCQKPDGTPIKFSVPQKDSLNFIVINISELHLSMIDKFDCLLTMYGDVGVPELFRRGIFGMWQELHDKSSEIEIQYHDKFKHFRETIHGVLFVRYVKDIGHMGRIYIDRELEYFAILNNNLLSREVYDLVIGKLALFLRKWANKENQ